MEERFTQQREEHRLDMDAMTRRFAVQMAAYDARFQSLEGVQSSIMSQRLPQRGLCTT